MDGDQENLSSRANAMEEEEVKEDKVENVEDEEATEFK